MSSLSLPASVPIFDCRELRIHLDPALECPPTLAPLIDPMCTATELCAPTAPARSRSRSRVSTSPV